MTKLEKLLLSKGGARVKRPPYHVDNRRIFRKGVLFEPERAGVGFIPGIPCCCHDNSVMMAGFFGKPLLDVYTGYALSDDGCWYSHSWLWDNFSGQSLIETTSPRLLYFGHALPKQEWGLTRSYKKWFANKLAIYQTECEEWRKRNAKKV